MPISEEEIPKSTKRRRIEVSGLSSKLYRSPYTMKDISDFPRRIADWVRRSTTAIPREWEELRRVTKRKGIEVSNARLTDDDLKIFRVDDDLAGVSDPEPHLPLGHSLLFGPRSRIYDEPKRYKRKKVDMICKAKGVLVETEYFVEPSDSDFVALKNRTFYLSHGIKVPISFSEGAYPEFKQRLGFPILKAFLLFLNRRAVQIILEQDKYLSYTDAQILYLVLRNYMNIADYEYFYEAYLKESHNNSFEG